jgi:UDP-3-O-[3-hydroxymyristoyl] glucosamine N-acyltransferase
MSERRTFTASEIANHVGGQLIGDAELSLQRVNSLESAGPEDLAYVEDEKLFSAARESQAGCVLVPEKFTTSNEHSNGKTLVVVARPKLAFALAAEILHPPVSREPSIHSSAVIAESADVALTTHIGPNVVVGDNSRVGLNTRIDAGVVIGANVTIGDDCVLHPNVVLYDGVTLRDRVILHAGVCIGADGFGYVRDDMGYHKFPQIGTVLIEEDVEIGAYTTIDRGALGQTRIGRGTKLDNLVHVGHNCDIGARVVIAAQTGISGSVTIEDDCVIGGQVGFGDHIHVQSGAVIGSKAGVLPGKIVRPGVWWGIPIQPLDDFKRLNAHLARVPQMREELKELRNRLRELEEKMDESS